MQAHKVSQSACMQTARLTSKTKRVSALRHCNHTFALPQKTLKYIAASVLLAPASLANSLQFAGNAGGYYFARPLGGRVGKRSSEYAVNLLCSPRRRCVAGDSSLR